MGACLLAAVDPSLHFQPVEIGIVASLILAITLSQAAILKLAVALCQGEPVGLFRASILVWAAAVCGGVSAASATFAAGEHRSSLLAFGAASIGSVLFLCLALHISPVRGFGVYLLNTFFGGIALFCLLIVASLGAEQILPPGRMDDLQGQLASRFVKFEREAGVDIVGLHPLVGAFEKQIHQVAAQASDRATVGAGTADADYAEEDFSQDVSLLRKLMEKHRADKEAGALEGTSDQSAKRWAEESGMHANPYATQ